MFDDCPQVMALVRSGDHGASTQIVERFTEKLKALATRRLDRRIRQKVDPEDIVQAVFHDFFSRCQSDDVDVASWDSLWALLAVMAMRRCAWESRFHTAARRDLRREIPDLTPQAEQNWLEKFATRDEAPETAVQLAETFARVMHHLDESDCEVVRLSLQGWTVGEISVEMKRHPRAVYRVLQSLRQRLVEQDSQILCLKG
jgi:RNA polymerase sigma factor (sigma-70 family)